jgi:hypothetical protein
MNNDEYEERGIFKQLVLIVYAAYVWCSLKIERAWKSESFYIVCAGICAAISIYCIIKLLIRTVR